MSFIIRPCNSNDAFRLSLLWQHLAEETDYLIKTPSEALALTENPREIHARWLDTSHRKIFSAEADKIYVGFCGLSRGVFTKNSHCASLIIGVLQNYWGKNVSTALLTQAEQW